MPVLFASTQEPFKPSKLYDFISKGDKNGSDTYVAKYFIKCLNPTCFMFWNGKHIIQLDSKGLGHYLDRGLKIDIHNKATNTVIKYNAFEAVTKCYIDERIISDLINDPKENRIVQTDEGIFLNTNAGLRFLNSSKVYTDFSDNVVEGVNLIWRHIKDALCDGNETHYNFFHDWICSVITGHKMESAVYLQSKQGVGKSMIMSFLRSVIGQSSFKPESPDVFFKKHNEELEGKTFICLEELESSDVAKKDLYTKMKELITGYEMVIEPKFKKPYTTKNRMNFIYATNEFGLKINDTERRLLMLYCSAKWRGNKEYFNKLAQVCNNPQIQEAFYIYCKDHYDKDFNHRYPPSSSLKTSNLGERLSSAHKFIKQEVLSDHLHIGDKINVKELYESYEEFCYKKRIKSISIQKFGQAMSKDFNISSRSVRIRGTKKRVYTINRDDLFDIFESNKWICEEDGIYRENEPENKDFGFLDKEDEKVYNLQEEVKALKKQLEEANKRIKEMTKSTETQNVEEPKSTETQNVEEPKTGKTRKISEPKKNETPKKTDKKEKPKRKKQQHLTQIHSNIKNVKSESL